MNYSTYTLKELSNLWYVSTGAQRDVIANYLAHRVTVILEQGVDLTHADREAIQHGQRYTYSGRS